MSKFTYPILFLFSLFILVGCGSKVKLKDSWQSDDINTAKSEKILVVNHATSEGIRQRGEREIANALKAKGIDAVEAFTAFPYFSTSVKRTPEEIDAVIKKIVDAGYGAVMITKLKNPKDKATASTRLTENEDIASETDAYFNTSTYGKYPMTFGVYLGAEGNVPNRTPGPNGLEETTDNFSEVFELVTVTYNIKPGKEQLLGSVTIDVTDPDNIVETLEKYAKLVANQFK